MVTISGFESRTNRETGEEFRVMILTGDVRFRKSANGGMYADVPKASYVSYVPEGAEQSLIGQKMPGKILSVTVEPYEVVDERTGETRVVSTRSEYVQPSQIPTPTTTVQEPA